MEATRSFKQYFHDTQPFRGITDSFQHIKVKKPLLHGEKFQTDFLYTLKFSYPELNQVITDQGLKFKVNKNNEDQLRYVFLGLKPALEQDFKSTLHLDALSVRQTTNTVGVTLNIVGEVMIYGPEQLYQFFTTLKRKDDNYEQDKQRYCQLYIDALEHQLAVNLNN